MAVGDPTEATTIRRVARAQRWTPEQGAADLHRRWSAAMSAAGLPPNSDGSFPVRDPHDDRSAAWRAFARDTLGFVPQAVDADQPRFQDFIARRYRRPTALNAAWGGAATSWQDVPLPAALPDGGARLADWYLFESVVMTTAETAHRFSVLLPIGKDKVYDVDEHERRRARADRVVRLEKPAHTEFDVKFYWAMFRIGEARLGLETLLDVGSRAPQLLPPMILGRGYLAESFLKANPPRDATDRQIVGRDPLHSPTERSS